MSDFTPSPHYPDPAVHILDPSFARYRHFNASLERLGTGMIWAEGPVYFADSRTLVLSDIPNNCMMLYDEMTGTFGLNRQPSNFSNGNARDGSIQHLLNHGQYLKGNLEAILIPKIGFYSAATCAR